MAVTCANGHENLDGMAFCEECGIELTAVTDRPDPVPQTGGDEATAGGSQPNPDLGQRPMGEPDPPPVDSGGQTPAGPPPPVESDTSQATPEPVLEVGSLAAPASNAPSPAASGMAAGAYLEVTQGPHMGRRFPITEPNCIIGRWDMDSGAFPEIDLTEVDVDAKVSRKHVRINKTEGQYFVEDLGSLNGTSLKRGPRLLPGDVQPLASGDELIIGKLFLRFVSN